MIRINAHRHKRDACASEGIIILVQLSNYADLDNDLEVCMIFID